MFILLSIHIDAVREREKSDLTLDERALIEWRKIKYYYEEAVTFDVDE